MRGLQSLVHKTASQTRRLLSERRPLSTHRLLPLTCGALVLLTSWAVAGVGLWLVPVYWMVLALLLVAPERKRPPASLHKPHVPVVSPGSTQIPRERLQTTPGPHIETSTSEHVSRSMDQEEESTNSTQLPASRKPRRPRAKPRDLLKQADSAGGGSTVTWVRVGPSQFVRVELPAGSEQFTPDMSPPPSVPNNELPDDEQPVSVLPDPTTPTIECSTTSESIVSEFQVSNPEPTPADATDPQRLESEEPNPPAPTLCNDQNDLADNDRSKIESGEPQADSEPATVANCDRSDLPQAFEAFDAETRKGHAPRLVRGTPCDFGRSIQGRVLWSRSALQRGGRRRVGRANGRATTGSRKVRPAGNRGPGRRSTRWRAPRAPPS